MVDKKCRKCGWYDPEYECTCPDNEPWQCVLNTSAIDELNKAVDEWLRSGESGIQKNESPE